MIPQQLALGIAWFVFSAAFLTVLIVEKVRKTVTPRTGQWKWYLLGSILGLGLGVFSILKYWH